MSSGQRGGGGHGLGHPAVSSPTVSGAGEPGRGDAGLAVLIVIAVTAALAALVTITSLGAAAGAAAASYRAQSEQASWLAASAISQTVAALRSGVLAVPAVGAPRRLVNGVDLVTGAAMSVGVTPAPVASWPQVVDILLAGEGHGRGAVVLIARVLGPDGEGRGLTGGADPEVLLDVEVDVWFRHARVAANARLLITATDVRRLH